jgi:hypothetical protein
MRGEERIEACDVRVDLRSGLRRRGHPRRSCGAAIADRPEEAVLGNGGLAEDLRKPAKADPPLELHLPQPILSVDITQGVEAVAFGCREDVRDGVGIADDLDRRRQTRDHDRAVDRRQRSARIIVRR